MAQDFSRNYSPPGVYIEEADSTLVSSVGVPPTIVALVGPARGYQINTEQFMVASGDYQLAQQGIDLTSVSVTRADTSEVVAAQDTYAVTKIGTETDQTYYSKFVLNEGEDSTLEVGDVIFVTYRYTNPGYYDPKTVDNFEDVKAFFGEPLNLLPPTPGQPYNAIASPLSLGAMKAIENGATDFVLVAAKQPTSGTDSAQSTARALALKDAYVKIESDISINVIVPITTGIGEADAPTVLTDLHTHLTKTANEGLLRFGIVGFDPSITSQPNHLLAASLSTRRPSDRRMMLAYAAPGGLSMYSGASNTTVAVGHSLLAAAFGGRMQALPIQQSLTKQSIVGFSGIAGTPLSNSLKNQYSSSGVAVVEQDRQNRLTVRHGVTTDPTNANTREASVVRARDGLVRSLQESTSTANLIGAPIDEDLLLSVKSNVQGVLESAVADEVIVSYTGLTLRQGTTDPSVVEVKFAYKPAYPLNYIVISFSIDTTTGTTSLTGDETV